MKIGILSDSHLGARNNCEIFNNHFLKFFDEIFFPYLEQHNIKTVFHLGDLGEYRKNVNTMIIDSWNKNIFERLKDYSCYFISGNHDIFYRQSNHITLQSSLNLDKIFGINIITSEPETITIDERKIDLIPWISNSNKDVITNFIKQSSSPLLFGHLETSGALMSPGQYCRDSHLENSIISKYHKVLSGHFHLRSEINNIIYIGNSYDIIWSDYGAKKGFVVLDTDTLELEYIDNPYQIFEKINFDEIIKHKHIDFDQYSKKHLKVYISPQSKKSKVESFITHLEKVNPLSVIIQETGAQSVIDKTFISENSSKETIFYIRSYLDNLFSNQQLHLNKDDLIKTMNDIYIQAQQLDL